MQASFLEVAADVWSQLDDSFVYESSSVEQFEYFNPVDATSVRSPFNQQEAVEVSTGTGFGRHLGPPGYMMKRYSFKFKDSSLINLNSTACAIAQSGLQGIS